MNPRVLIVDGHSAIFQSKELKTLHAQKPRSARHRLVQMLTRYSDATGIHVVLVFDGQGPKVSEEHILNGIQIFYSKKDQTADAIIERLTAKYASSHDIRVATDDFQERQTVDSTGGTWLSIVQLFSEIQDANKNLDSRIRKLRRPLL